MNSGRHDVKAYLTTLSDRGYTIRRRKGSYFVLDGTAIVTCLSQTPSDHRWLKNSESYIRRYERKMA